MQIILFLLWPSVLSVAIVKHSTKSRLVRKWFIWLTCLITVYHCESQARSSSRNCTESKRSADYGLAPWFMLSWLSQTTQLHHLSRCCPPQALQWQASIKAVPHRNDHRPIWLKQLFSWGSQMILGLCQIDNKSLWILNNSTNQSCFFLYYYYY